MDGAASVYLDGVPIQEKTEGRSGAAVRTTGTLTANTKTKINI